MVISDSPLTEIGQSPGSSPSPCGGGGVRRRWTAVGLPCTPISADAFAHAYRRQPLEFVVLDCRCPACFDHAHVHNAVNVRVGDPELSRFLRHVQDTAQLLHEERQRRQPTSPAMTTLSPSASAALPMTSPTTPSMTPMMMMMMSPGFGGSSLLSNGTPQPILTTSGTSSPPPTPPPPSSSHPTPLFAHQDRYLEVPASLMGQSTPAANGSSPVSFIPTGAEMMTTTTALRTSSPPPTAAAMPHYLSSSTSSSPPSPSPSPSPSTTTGTTGTTTGLLSPSPSDHSSSSSLSAIGGCSGLGLDGSLRGRRYSWSGCLHRFLDESADVSIPEYVLDLERLLESPNDRLIFRQREYASVVVYTSGIDASFLAGHVVAASFPRVENCTCSDSIFGSTSLSDLAEFFELLGIERGHTHWDDRRSLVTTLCVLYCLQQEKLARELHVLQNDFIELLYDYPLICSGSGAWSGTSSRPLFPAGGSAPRAIVGCRRNPIIVTDSSVGSPLDCSPIVIGSAPIARSVGNDDSMLVDRDDPRSSVEDDDSWLAPLPTLSEYLSHAHRRLFQSLSFRFHCEPASMILDYLFLGSVQNATNEQQLKQFTITFVVNAATECRNQFASSSNRAKATIKYLNCPIEDRVDENISRYFDKVFAFIDCARAQNAKVLVHCFMGISRSAAFVIAYLMRQYGMSMAHAFEFVKSRRPIVDPNIGFLRQVAAHFRDYSMLPQSTAQDFISTPVS